MLCLSDIIFLTRKTILSKHCSNKMDIADNKYTTQLKNCTENVIVNNIDNTMRFKHRVF